jgi:cytochrome P450
MRLATGVTMRCPRIAPTEALVYEDYVIPPGVSNEQALAYLTIIANICSQTVISQINYFVMMDPRIFPKPSVFDPERWLRAAAEGEHLERYLVNFSKGSRNCIGLK